MFLHSCTYRWLVTPRETVACNVCSIQIHLYAHLYVYAFMCNLYVNAGITAGHKIDKGSALEEFNSSESRGRERD